MISKKWVMVDSLRIEAVKSWVRPSSMADVKSFMDLASYYRRFIKNFAFIDNHLTRLTQKQVLFI